ncbi:ABC transporter permease subunit [Bdellovibrio sp. NC01]|uniref:ABC transporter permease subunit n=1 Tax=Bdellovibrio sp. NC01 TaxID=2220073 RepID=UPI001FEF5268|nr:ABC transporter permease subunit [Bdellovibrio sp. NC01]
MSQLNLRNLLRLSLVLFLVFPFLFLLTQFRFGGRTDWAELAWAFKNSFLQAFFSAVFALIFGFWSALGLLTFTNHRRHYRMVLEILCLLPNFLPPIFILLATLNVVDPFPMGITGIVFIHTLMNFGLAAVLLAGLIENKVGGVIELAYVEGSSRFNFLTKGLIPMLKKDLWLLWLFIFVVCFGSFSVPLIVGGGKGTTVEVLIYEKIRLSSDWSNAVFLAFLQSIFIFALSWIAGKGQGSHRSRLANLNLVRMPTGILVIGGISLLYLAGYVQGLFAGVKMLSTFYEAQSAIVWNFLGSLSVGLSVGVFCYVGLMVIAFCWPKAWFEKFLNGYVAPSTSLACFALLIFGPNEGINPFIKIPLALTLLSLNSLFRMGWDGELHSLHSQMTVARCMGASSKQIFWEILFPQLSSRAGVLAGIASIWACGDFAVSRILAHRDLSIAMMTETLMSSYRLNQATVLSLLIVVAGLICFAICVGGSRVLRRKLTP